MNYQQSFDRLGNPVYRRRQPDWQHRLIRRAAVAAIAACLFVMLWVR